MNVSDLLQHLRGLEVELHQPFVRSDVDRLDQVLHDSFLEFGKSGVRLSKSDVLELLPLESRRSRIWSESYELSMLAEGVALLTYKTAHADESGKLSGHTLRSSIWVRTPFGWQIRFHQGTPTDAFRERAP